MMPPIAEWSTVVVSLIYLIGAYTVAVLMARNLRWIPPAGRRVARWAFLAVLTLALGDSFHTVPRMYRTFTGLLPLPEVLTWFGRSWDWIALGLVISSATMSLFYLLAFQYDRERRGAPSALWLWVMLGLLTVRLGILPCPLNGWEGHAAPGWRVYRNIPFTLMGAITVASFFQGVPDAHSRERRLRRAIAWCMIASFATYWVTVLGAERYPVLGAMMLPKTIAYLVMVILLYQLLFPSENEPSRLRPPD
ncbi:MAG: hypothetical protein ACUVXE_10535 [Anaerolineae bacterium]